MKKYAQSNDVTLITTYDIVETHKLKDDWPIREQVFYMLVVSNKHNFRARIKDIIQ